MARSGVVNVYLEQEGPRAAWVFQLILGELLGQRIEFVTRRPEGPLSDAAWINYSSVHLPGALNITPFGLLSESGIREQDFTRLDYEGLPAFFPVSGGDLPFDPFSMAFFLVARYEEYLPFEPDDHGRFPARASLAHRKGFLQVAVVNRLANIIREKLEKTVPGLHIPLLAYTFIPTIDVDIAYAHLGKGFTRAAGAFAKLLFRGDFAEIWSRVNTMTGRAQDPYDNFAMISETCKAYGLVPKYFILAGKPGPHDRNLSLKNRRFVRLLKDLSEGADIGVHPSYGAGNSAEKIRREKERLGNAIDRDVKISRQHFVRLRFPDTYDALLRAGIKADYSMGYADAQGFRASIASPYDHYDLRRDKATGLRVYPFMFMDSSMADYLGLHPGEYFDNVRPLIDEVKQTGGTLVGIWHNYAMADDTNKQKAFQEILQYAASR